MSRYQFIQYLIERLKEEYPPNHANHALYTEALSHITTFQNEVNNGEEFYTIDNHLDGNHSISQRNIDDILKQDNIDSQLSNWVCISQFCLKVLKEYKESLPIDIRNGVMRSYTKKISDLYHHRELLQEVLENNKTFTLIEYNIDESIPAMVRYTIPIQHLEKIVIAVRELDELVVDYLNDMGEDDKYQISIRSIRKEEERLIHADEGENPYSITIEEALENILKIIGVDDSETEYTITLNTVFEIA